MHFSQQIELLNTSLWYRQFSRTVLQLPFLINVNEVEVTIQLPKATFYLIIFGLSKSAMHEDLDNADRKVETHL